jgi:hypothetical protein
MNIYEKIRKFCRIFRIILGVSALIAGFYFTAEEETYNLWFALGLLPLIAGILNFCPICIISKKCDIETDSNNSEDKN